MMPSLGSTTVAYLSEQPLYIKISWLADESIAVLLPLRVTVC